MPEPKLPILQMTKRLVEPPAPAPSDQPEGVKLVASAGSAEIACWVEIQRQALADLPTPVRPPTAADLRRELLEREGWQAGWLWFAVLPTDEAPASLNSPLAGGIAVGTVGLSIRAGRDTQRAVIHRLAVVPQARRRGIGRLLLATAEQAAWEAGNRQLWLETHARWEAAVALYRSQDWEEVQFER